MREGGGKCTGQTAPPSLPQLGHKARQVGSAQEHLKPNLEQLSSVQILEISKRMNTPNKISNRLNMAASLSVEASIVLR